jgi:hypothetical protein
MSKLVIGLAVFVLLAAGGALAGGALTDSSLDDGVTSTIDETTTSGETTTTNETATLGTTTNETQDVSGPCDEAEHADDPRCTGAEPGDDDRQGRGGDDDRRGRDDDGKRNQNDHDDNDRSGSNSGRG